MFHIWRIKVLLDAKFTDATLRVKNKFGFDCILKARIKPHGDLLDHYRDFGQVMILFMLFLV